MFNAVRTCWSTCSLTSKIVGSIVLVLAVTATISFWIIQSRVNRQADDAFTDKLQMMTEIALGSRVSSGEGGHAWQVIQQYSQTQGYLFRTPAREPNDPKDTLNSFDERAFAAFESHPADRQYLERSKVDGRPVLLFAKPVRITSECKSCHTWPESDENNAAQAGSRHISALFSMTAPLDALAANQRSNAFAISLTSLGTLFLGAVTVFLLIRKLVTRPLHAAFVLADEISDNNLAVEDIPVVSEDEMGRTARALNKMKENLRQIIQAISGTAGQVSAASEQLNSTSQQITANSEETSAQAKVVSSSAEQVSHNLQTVATGAEQMGASIKEIAKNATEAAKVASSAVHVAETTTATVSKLGDSSTEIGQVIKVITSIAQQTNLLALNATIEAARAGEAGKGFAVVANEVKELAKETAKATEDISRKIEAIQTDTKAAVEAIASISQVIVQVNDISNTIATAVEEQNATTNEMSRNISEAASGSGEITSNIGGVAQAADSTSRGAEDTQKAAQQLVETSRQLQNLVEQFKIDSNGTPGQSVATRHAVRAVAAGG
jgi:methyl-accepting chemotaxis protein